MRRRDDPRAAADVDRALAFAQKRDLDGYAQYLLGMRAVLRLQRGRWAEAEADAHEAIERLRSLTSPFTLSQARKALGTTRRVAVPIMELLARRGISRQLPDGTHELR